MIRTVRMIAVSLAVAMSAIGAANAATPKFRPVPGTMPVVGRYVVTLGDSVAEDLVESSAKAMAMSYSGQLEPSPSSNVRQFAISMAPARARTLSADPRVREVVEIPQSDEAGSAAPSAPSRADLSRHGFVPAEQDSSSSGTYLYDGAGNIKAIGSDTFVYDVVGRLKQAIVQGSQQNYDYDAFGNRILTTRASNATGCVGGCEAPSTVYPQSNHLTGASYDVGGNVISANGVVYSYDGTGMVTRATVGSDDRMFIYTADDERIGVRNGVSWIWTVRGLDNKVLREFTSSETQSSPLVLTSHIWTKDYVWRDGLLLASVVPTTPGTITPSTTYHYHLDHLGTPRLITDNAGVLVAKHTYYPFGAEMDITPHESTTELMKFTGHERDVVAADNASVDYMHARYYNGNLGRFMSVDPVLGKLGQPQSWNRYAYVTNNPIGRTDPTGRCGVAVLLAFAPACGVVDLADYVQQRGGQIAEAVKGMGPSASTAENLMGAGVVAIVAADVALNTVEPGKAAISAIAETTAVRVLETAGRAASPEIQAGARALDKKLGHAAAGGFESAFAGIKPTQANAEKLIKNILSNPAIVDVKTKYVDVFNKAGQGVRYNKSTNEFVTFLEGMLRK